MSFKKQRRLNYEETVRFHGHDGPLLALGYRLGKFIVRELKPAGIMGLEIKVRTRREKPFTCLLDGLQCATFATLGKGNIIIEDSSSDAIVVHARADERSMKFVMNRRAIELCFTSGDLQRMARKILRTPVEELWRIRS